MEFVKPNGEMLTSSLILSGLNGKRKGCDNDEEEEEEEERGSETDSSLLFCLCSVGSEIDSDLAFLLCLAWTSGRVVALRFIV